MLRAVLTSFTLLLLSFTSPGADNSESVVVAAPAKTGEGAAMSFEEKQLAYDQYVKDIYSKANLENSGMAFNVFQKALVGHQNFKQKKLVSSDKSIVTIIDFTKPSRTKRMWIVDLEKKKVLYNDLVAHGRNTGEEKAVYFSNKPNSFMSSMGFYVTDKTYFGKHGLSLRVAGMDKEYNSNAMSRAIVIHGADYVSEAFIKQYGRLGRSLGCPALPQAITKDVIQVIKDRTTIYIHGADKNYTSDFLNQQLAVESFALELPTLASNV